MKKIRDDVLIGQKYKFTLLNEQLDTSTIEKIKRKISNLDCYKSCVYVKLFASEQEVPLGAIQEVCFFRCREFQKTSSYYVEIKVYQKQYSNIYNKIVTQEHILSLFNEIAIQRSAIDLENWKLISTINQNGVAAKSQPDPLDKLNDLHMQIIVKKCNKAEIHVSHELGRILANAEYASKYIEEHIVFAKPNKIIQYFEKGYSTNARIACARADLEFFGQIGRPNYQFAYQLYSHAAKIGSLRARYQLAKFYKYGLYLPQDTAKYYSMMDEIYNLYQKYHKEWYSFITMCDFLLDLAKIEKDRGDYEQALKLIKKMQEYCIYVLEYTDCDWEMATECLNVKYSMIDFDCIDCSLFDLFYIAQKPCTISITINGEVHTLQVKKWHTYFYVECAGKAYQDVADFLSNYLIQGAPIITYQKSVNMIQIVDAKKGDEKL